MGRSRRRYFRSLIIIVPTRWPCGQRRRPMATRVLGLRVWIPLEVRMFVCCECCVLLQVEISATGWSLVVGSPTDCECVIGCDNVQQWPAVDSVTLFSHVSLFGSVTVFSHIFQVSPITLFCYVFFSWLYCII
jgi:hypothetical protein